VSDAEELRIQRKARQTEGLELWRQDEWGWFVPVVNDIQTSHPDSVAGNSQAGLILRHLQSGGTLTALDALDLFGCNRLAARVSDLRAKGYRVQSTLIELPNGKRVASYALLDK